jgi:hypothetical protein
MPPVPMTWQRAAATKLALCLQSIYRGIKARALVRTLRIRRIVKVKRLLPYQHILYLPTLLSSQAIRVIQAAYRYWKLLRFSQKSSYHLKTPAVSLPSTTLPWEALMKGRGSYSDRIQLWRAVIVSMLHISHLYIFFIFK